MTHLIIVRLGKAGLCLLLIIGLSLGLFPIQQTQAADAGYFADPALIPGPEAASPIDPQPGQNGDEPALTIRPDFRQAEQLLSFTPIISATKVDDLFDQAGDGEALWCEVTCEAS